MRSTKTIDGINSEEPKGKSTVSDGIDKTKSPNPQGNQQKTDKKVKEPQNEEVQGDTQGVGQIGEESSQWNTLSEEDAKMLIQNMEDSLLPNSSDMHLAENPNGLPDLLPTQESNESISEDKDTSKSPNPQENQQKTDEKVEEPQNEEVQGGVQGEFQNNEPQPIGEGDFGPIYNQFKGNAKGAVVQLSKIRNGEATAALHHKDIGDIDIVWGNEGTGHSDGFGLAKLLKYHPEVVDKLQEIIDEMSVVSRSENRINLESEKYKAGVRLTWNEKKKLGCLHCLKRKTVPPTIRQTLAKPLITAS